MRLATLRPSSTLAVNARAQAMRAQGVDVLSFAAGEPDFDTPARIKEAAIAALREGMTKYVPIPGDPVTRSVIAEKLARENGIPNVTPDHVVLSNGGKHNLYLLLQALIDPHAPGEPAQEVLLPTPSWVSYAPQVELSGGRVVELPTTPENDFKITPAQLRAAITPRSRVLILNSPSNPCGTMYTPDELRALAHVVVEASATTAPDLVVLSDELYEKIVYAGIPHLSIGSIPEIAERTITINGMSKAYAMTGWRIGYSAGSGAFGLQVAKALCAMQGQTTTHITSFTLPAIRVALTECAAEVEQMRQAFARRAELTYKLVRRVPGLLCPRPTGAFYVFPDVSAHFGKRSAKNVAIGSAAAFCEALLDEHHVAAVPGEDFLGWGVRCVRFSFACSEEQIERGLERLGAFVAGLR